MILSTLFIYIPLCFYFILTEYNSELGILSFTFHYASTLSKRVFNCACVLIWIYIPLCFYFIIFQFCPAPLLFSIYIPLCFYFIDELIRVSKHQIIIYIPLCFYFIGKSLSGTLYDVAHLHSTMLLLYR